MIGDATALPFADWTFDAVITSPTYGNRMADHHNAQDGSRRVSYRHSGKHPARWSAAVLSAISRVYAPADGPHVLDPFAGVGAGELEGALPGARVVGVELDPDWAAGRDRPINHPLHVGNTGRYQWGQRYRDLHIAAWWEAARVVRPGGMFVLNASDHVRAGMRQDVVLWHMVCLEDAGFVRQRIVPVETPRMGFGENAGVRVPCEFVIAFRKE